MTVTITERVIGTDFKQYYIKIKTHSWNFLNKCEWKIKQNYKYQQNNTCHYKI